MRWLGISDLPILKVPTGESGLAQQVPAEKAEKLVELFCNGNVDEVGLGRAVGLSTMTVHRALRTPNIQAMIRAEAKAIANMAMPDLVRAASDEAKFGDYRTKGAAREFVRKVAEDQQIIQINNMGQPTDFVQEHEALIDRLHGFMRDTSYAVAVQAAETTVQKCLEAGDDD